MFFVVFFFNGNFFLQYQFVYLLIHKLDHLTMSWPCHAGVELSGCCWQIHPAEDNINKVISGISPCHAGVELSGCCWQLHPAEENINKVITGISPCHAGVVISADVVDSFIKPKKISTKWLPEYHHVMQVLNSADVVDSFIKPKKISTKWLPEYHHVMQVLNSADVVDSFIRPKIISTKWFFFFNGNFFLQYQFVYLLIHKLDHLGNFSLYQS